MRIITFFTLAFLTSYTMFTSKSEAQQTSKKMEQIHNISSVESDTTNTPTLKPFIQILQRNAINTTSWALAVVHNDESVKLIDPKIAAEKLKSVDPTDELYGYSPNKIAEAVLEFSYYCGTVGHFLPSLGESKISPIQFFKRKDGLGILFSGMVSESVYNTLQLNAKARAAKAISACLLPRIEGIYQALGKTDLKCYGITYYYGARNFADDSSLTDEEMVVLIVSKNTAKAYANAAITGNELLRKSDIYLTDKNMFGSVRKISVQL